QMKTYRKELWFEAKQRRQFFRITPQIHECVRESGVKEGLALVNAMHITASVFINDNESGSITTSRNGWKNWRRRSRIRNTNTMEQKITQMLTLNAALWGVRLSLRSQTGSSTSVRGKRSFMANLTEIGANVYWLKSLVNEHGS